MFKVKIFVSIPVIIFSQITHLFATSVRISWLDSVPHKLLYIVQVDPKSSDFMIPYIEQKLKNLRYANQDKRLYDSVVSLNIITQRSTIQASIITNLINNRIISTPIAPADIKRDSNLNYVKFMQDYDETLLIKLNTFNNLIELQFTLFQRVQNPATIRYATSSSVFVNPDKPHYQLDIINTLNQVFDRANSKPEFSIISNKPKINSTYFLTTADTLSLEPIVDDGSPEDDRIYFWSQDFRDSVQAHVEMSKKDQKLKNLGPGTYTLFFKVSNSINYSRTDTIHVTVYVKPSLKIQRLAGKYLFGARSDRLIIQEYLLTDRNIISFETYSAKIIKNQFSDTDPTLYVRLYDKKGEIYADRLFAFLSPSTNIILLNTGSNRIIDELNTMTNSMTSVRTNKYVLSFIAQNANMHSNEEKRDLEVFQRRPISLIYDAAISPLNKYRNRFFNSWLNVAIGFDLRFTNFLFVSSLIGTNASNESFRHSYTNFIANFTIPGTKIEAGPAVFIGDDNSTISLGFKASFIVFQNGRTNIKIGISYYNRGLSDYYSLHYTGNIFFNH